MPCRKRSTSVIFALYSMLTVLTIFGVSSGGLKADTPNTPAEVATTPAPIASDFNIQQPNPAEHGEGIQPSVAGKTLEKDLLSNRYRLAQSNWRCTNRCIEQTYNCLERMRKIYPPGNATRFNNPAKEECMPQDMFCKIDCNNAPP